MFQAKPKFHLYTKPFSWKQKLPILPVIRAQEEAYEAKKNAPNSISLIAGVYGENSDQVIKTMLMNLTKLHLSQPRNKPM